MPLPIHIPTGYKRPGCPLDPEDVKRIKLPLDDETRPMPVCNKCGVWYTFRNLTEECCWNETGEDCDFTEYGIYKEDQDEEEEAHLKQMGRELMSEEAGEEVSGYEFAESSEDSESSDEWELRSEGEQRTPLKMIQVPEQWRFFGVDRIRFLKHSWWYFRRLSLIHI